MSIFIFTFFLLFLADSVKNHRNCPTARGHTPCVFRKIPVK